VIDAGKEIEKLREERMIAFWLGVLFAAFVIGIILRPQEKHGDNNIRTSETSRSN
jgi:hypothetical protein